MKRILIIDDDTELCDLLEEYLATEKFEPVSDHGGKTGLEKAKSGDFDLVILDVMLPELNGLEVLKSIRAFSRIPVIMLTAKGDEVDRILGLELGADDYLPKPFSPRELVARIKAVSRRLSPEKEENRGKKSSRIKIDDVFIESNTRTATKAELDLGLTEVEFSILENLMLAAGSVVERQDLALKVLGRRLSYDDRSLDVHMSNLRRKLGQGENDRERIKTIRGIGYLYVRPEN
ncbi:MAG: response regulator transcription factor [Candidatus Riflebacteria bacterium]|nr:response regulator transcription factor [Candidatus Riflebacteria bacterium]